MGDRHPTGDPRLASVARPRRRRRAPFPNAARNRGSTPVGGGDVAQPTSPCRGSNAARWPPDPALCLPIGRSRYGSPRPRRSPRTDQRSRSHPWTSVPRRLRGCTQTGSRTCWRRRRTRLCHNPADDPVDLPRALGQLRKAPLEARSAAAIVWVADVVPAGDGENCDRSNAEPRRATGQPGKRQDGSGPSSGPLPLRGSAASTIERRLQLALVHL